MKNNLEEVYSKLMDSYPFRLEDSPVIYRFIWEPFKGGYKKNDLSLKCQRYSVIHKKWTGGYLKLYSFLMSNIILIENIENEEGVELKSTH